LAHAVSRAVWAGKNQWRPIELAEDVLGFVVGKIDRVRIFCIFLAFILGIVSKRVLNDIACWRGKRE